MVWVLVAVGCGTRTGLLSRDEDGATVADDDVGDGADDGGWLTWPDGSYPVCGSEPNACESDGLDAYERLGGVLASCKVGVRCSDAVTAAFDDAGCLSSAFFLGLTPDEERCVIARTAGARHPCFARAAFTAQGPCP